jgi:hypothetical protein
LLVRDHAEQVQSFRVVGPGGEDPAVHLGRFVQKSALVLFQGQS